MMVLVEEEEVQEEDEQDEEEGNEEEEEEQGVERPICPKRFIPQVQHAFELTPPDGRAACPVAPRHVASLDHKVPERRGEGGV